MTLFTKGQVLLYVAAFETAILKEWIAE